MNFKMEPRVTDGVTVISCHGRIVSARRRLRCATASKAL